MPLSKNPFFHSQTRRKSDSAAIPIRDRNVKRNTAISTTTRNRFAPPVPPKDKPPKIPPPALRISEAKKTLDALEKDWMLNDCIGSMPTPISEGGSAQEYIANSINARSKNGSLKSSHDSTDDKIGALRLSDGMLQDAQSGVKAQAIKRDTVVVLMDEIMGSDKKVPRRHQDVLEAAATLGALPLPLRIANKLKTSPRGSSVPPAFKSDKLEPGTRPSLRIATTFTDPRTAPIPLDIRRSDTRHMSHAHVCKKPTPRTSITDGKISFFKDRSQVQQRSNVSYISPKPGVRGKSGIRNLQEKAQQPFTKQRRANTFPVHKSLNELQHVRDTHLVPTPPKRRNTQPITVNRMRDPDETFHELLAIHKRATADFDEDNIPDSKGQNKNFGSVTGGECTGLYATAKTHVDDMMENVRNMRQKDRERRRREKMKGEIRRKYEEMVSADASAKRGDEV